MAIRDVALYELGAALTGRPVSEMRRIGRYLTEDRLWPKSRTGPGAVRHIDNTASLALFLLALAAPSVEECAAFVRQWGALQSFRVERHDRLAEMIDVMAQDRKVYRRLQTEYDWQAQLDAAKKMKRDRDKFLTGSYMDILGDPTYPFRLIVAAILYLASDDDTRQGLRSGCEILIMRGAPRARITAGYMGLTISATYLPAGTRRDRMGFDADAHGSAIDSATHVTGRALLALGRAFDTGDIDLAKAELETQDAEKDRVENHAHEHPRGDETV